MTKCVVTRHKALIQYLKDEGLVENDVEVLEHAIPEQIKGKDVIGVLPIYLASLTKSITIVPLSIPRDLRGKELTLEQVQQYASTPTTYVVKKV